MQQRWLKRQLSASSKVTSSVTEFLKKFEESTKSEASQAAASSSPEPTPAQENERKPDSASHVSKVEKAPNSPGGSRDESFLSDADGHGSIAEVIGRT